MTAAAEDASNSAYDDDNTKSQRPRRGSSIHDQKTSSFSVHISPTSSKIEATPGLLPKRKRIKRPTTSPYFPSPSPSKSKNKAPVSCIPFPPLTSTTFGLAQERLAHDPFHLLVAVIFLNKTRGTVAMPVFYELIARYPTPEDLANAEHDDVLDLIQHLGLQNQRARSIVNIARTWLDSPPVKGRRHRCLHYPRKGDGSDVKPNEVLADETEDPRIGWEIAHLPGLGAYAFDSWRIFCRDRLRGIEIEDENDIGDGGGGFDSLIRAEWTRVIPKDKELRAYLRWRWLKAGWVWDPLTGDRERASKEQLADAKGGGVMIDGNDEEAEMAKVVEKSG